MASLVYTLENRYFDGVDDYVDTGIKLFDSNKDWVVFIDFTADAVQGEEPIIFDAIDGSLWCGFAVVAATQMLSGANNTKAPQFDTPVLGNRHCIALRKIVSNSTYQFVIPNKSITSFEEILIDGISNKDVFIGAFQVGSSYDYPFKGTIHSCKIWFGTMTDSEFESLVNPIPIITIGTPSRTKISRMSGHDQATVTFQSDMALQSWEARATISGQVVGHGSGLLVESGGSLAAYTNATVYVDDEELTNGDQEYTITVFGHGSDGYWSDGTYEAVNLLDLSTAVFWYHNATVSNDIVTYDTGTSNIESSKISIDLFLNGDYKGSVLTARSVGNYSAILNKDSSFDTFALLLSGDSAYGSIEMNTSMMEDGERYIFSCTIDSFSLNQAVVSNISLVKAVI